MGDELAAATATFDKVRRWLKAQTGRSTEECCAAYFSYDSDPAAQRSGQTREEYALKRLGGRRSGQDPPTTHLHRSSTHGLDQRPAPSSSDYSADACTFSSRSAQPSSNYAYQERIGAHRYAPTAVRSEARASNQDDRMTSVTEQSREREIYRQADEANRERELSTLRAGSNTNAVQDKPRSTRALPATPGPHYPQTVVPSPVHVAAPSSSRPFASYPSLREYRTAQETGHNGTAILQPSHSLNTVYTTPQDDLRKVAIKEPSLVPAAAPFSVTSVVRATIAAFSAVTTPAPAKYPAANPAVAYSPHVRATPAADPVPVASTVYTPVTTPGKEVTTLPQSPAARVSDSSKPSVPQKSFVTSDIIGTARAATLLQQPLSAESSMPSSKSMYPSTAPNAHAATVAAAQPRSAANSAAATLPHVGSAIPATASTANAPKMPKTTPASGSVLFSALPEAATNPFAKPFVAHNTSDTGRTTASCQQKPLLSKSSTPPSGLSVSVGGRGSLSRRDSDIAGVASESSRETPSGKQARPELIRPAAPTSTAAPASPSKSASSSTIINRREHENEENGQHQQQLLQQQQTAATTTTTTKSKHKFRYHQHGKVATVREGRSIQVSTGRDSASRECKWTNITSGHLQLVRDDIVSYMVSDVSSKQAGSRRSSNVSNALKDSVGAEAEVSESNACAISRAHLETCAARPVEVWIKYLDYAFEQVKDGHSLKAFEILECDAPLQELCSNKELLSNPAVFLRLMGLMAALASLQSFRTTKTLAWLQREAVFTEARQTVPRVLLELQPVDICKVLDYLAVLATRVQNCTPFLPILKEIQGIVMGSQRAKSFATCQSDISKHLFRFSLAPAGHSTRAQASVVLTAAESEKAIKLKPGKGENFPVIPEKGPFESVEAHLDTLFELHRADALWALREGIHDLYQGKLDQRDMAVMLKVHITGIFIPDSGTSDASIILELKLTPCVPPSSPSQSSLLCYGNLLCLSSEDSTSDTVWATVVERLDTPRPTKAVPHPEWRVAAALCSELSDVSVSRSIASLLYRGKSTIALQSPTYFRAHAPVMQRLKHITEADLPLQDTLTFAKRTLPDLDESAACWLQRAPKAKLVVSKTNDTLDRHLERLASSTLDEFQQNAVRCVFEQPIAIIQGVPGGGKSFIGVHIVEMLNNMQSAGARMLNTPIVVITYKNHSLDEFLLDCDKVWPGAVVRFGGRADEKLAHMAISEFTKRYKTKEFGERRAALEQDLRTTRAELKAALERYAACLRFNSRVFKDFATPIQVLNLVLAHLRGDFPSSDAAAAAAAATSNTQSKGKNSKNKDKKNGTKTPDGSAFLANASNSLDMKLAFINKNRELLDDAVSAWQKPAEKLLWASSRSNGKSILAEKLLANSKASAHDDELLQEEEQDRKAEEAERIAAEGSSQQDSACKRLPRISIFPEPWAVLMEDGQDDLTAAALRNSDDVSQVAPAVRAEYIKTMMKECQMKLKSEIDRLSRETELLIASGIEMRNLQRANLLKAHAKVVGFTITGACIHNFVIQQLRPEIIVVEEAAEITEPQLIACLHSDLKQLIMIGDHQQLPPSVESFFLEKNCNLSVSLMQRMINNELPFATLQKQNRMHPDISRYLRDIYPSLQDNMDRVGKISVIAYVGRLKPSPSPVFWWDHHTPEIKDRGFSNKEEVDRAIALARFLVEMGEPPETITVLSGYKAQTRQLRSKLKEAAGLSGKKAADGPGDASTNSFFKTTVLDDAGNIKVQVETIDRYQGDENDIIILSMTRSNTEKKCGFMGDIHRRCVAASRARRALYIIGDFNLFHTEVSTWLPMTKMLESEDLVSPSLPVRCPRHPKCERLAASAIDLAKTLCPNTCSLTAMCGHECRMKCHVGPCKGKCVVKELYTCPFGHSIMLECFQKTTYQCLNSCTKDLACKHRCPNKCFDKCATPAECKVEIKVACKEGHYSMVACGVSSAFSCDHPCGKPLECGHPCTLPCVEGCATSDACSICLRFKKEEVKLAKQLSEAAHKEEIDKLKEQAEAIKGKGFLLVLLDPRKKEDIMDFNMVRDRVEKFVQADHNVMLSVESVQRVVNPNLKRLWLEARSELRQADNAPKSLFHGTGAAKKIAENGFLLPKVSDQNMFGQGVYFATDSSKSAQEMYTKGTNELLLCDVALGKQCTVDGFADYEGPLKQHMKKNNKFAYLDVDLAKVNAAGFDSVYAPRDTRSKGGVHFDEFIVYDPRLALPQFIVKYSTGNGLRLKKSIMPEIPAGKKHALKDLVSGRFVSNSEEELLYRFAESQVLRMFDAKVVVTKVSLITNPTLERAFRDREQQMKRKGTDKCILAFHGSTTQAYDMIAENNFDVGKLAANTGNKGFYGAGIYFSEHPKTALGYTRGSKMLLLSHVLIGKAYKCPGLMMGAPLSNGFDSHESPDGHEIVVFQGNQILPKFIVHLQ